MAILKTGNEPMTFHGQSTGHCLNDFWRQHFSDLLSNTLRGSYAEFIVSSALGVDIKGSYEEWAPWDITLPFDWTDASGTRRNEIRIEVKSSAYIQSWSQKKLSRIVFGIRPTQAWNENNRREAVPIASLMSMFSVCIP